MTETKRFPGAVYLNTSDLMWSATSHRKYRNLAFSSLPPLFTVSSFLPFEAVHDGAAAF